MDTETMIRELENVEEKHKHDKVFTGQLNVAEMAHDVRKRLEELKPYEDTGLDPEQIRQIDRQYTEKYREVAKLQQRDTPVKVKPIEIYHPVGYRVEQCSKCENIVRDYMKFCFECGCQLEWGSWEEWEDSHETKNSGGE